MREFAGSRLLQLPIIVLSGRLVPQGLCQVIWANLGPAAAPGLPAETLHCTLCSVCDACVMGLLARG